MFYTGKQRDASSILLEQKKNIQSKNKIEILKEMVKLVWEARDALYEGNLNKFGNTLHKNWLLKQKLASKITNPGIDSLYNKALNNGAIGGKLLGAGSGGFLLFYCDQKNQDKLRSAMSPLKELRFKFENEGSKLIYVGDEYDKH